ncbi:MAG: DUF362 domain-containing protein [Lachnospiraceae bacterium]|nr:DUF362 domain-containing protein [Lachnospiraceae bacterium]
MKPNQILKIYGTEYKENTKALLTAARLAEMIPSPDSRIAVKPNLVCPSPAEFGATTHPEVVAGIIEYLQENGFRNIVITEGSWIGDRTEDAFEICGFRSLSEKYGVPFVDTQKSRSFTEEQDGFSFLLTDAAAAFDFLINVPVLKGHCQTRVTCALKNLKGLLPNTEKRRFHKEGLHRPIAHLAAAVKQDFIVIDHICGDPDFEEGGRPLVRNCIMAAADPVLADSYACRLLGVETKEVPYIGFAEELGAGCSDLGRAEILQIEEKEPGLFRFLKDTEEPLSGHALDVSYAAEDADACSACYSSLIGALFRLGEEGLLSDLKEKIGIGQGMCGRTGNLGVGKCTAAFKTSIPGCPPDEEAIYAGLREYILSSR